MKSVVVVATLASLVGVAGASPMLKPPAGWTGGASPELVEQTGRMGHFGGVHGIIEAERYDAPKPGVVLYVTRIAAEVTMPSAAARAEVDALHSSANETEWREHVDDAALEVEALVAWRDPGAHIAGSARIVLVATVDHRIVAVRGDCLTADDADPALVTACKASLLTLDPGVAAGRRVAMLLSPATAAPVVATTSEPAPAHMGDGSHVPLPPIAVPQEQPATDRRPVVVGLGVVMLAAVFWWNRRRRAQLEKETR